MMPTIKRFFPIENADGYRCGQCAVVLDKEHVPGHVCGRSNNRGRCKHRGKEIRRVECPTCVGSVKLKVLSCDLHLECCIDKVVPGVRSCSGCVDFSIAPIDESLEASSAFYHTPTLLTNQAARLTATHEHPFKYSGIVRPEYISLSQRGRDVRQLASMLPVSTSRIIGIARSGLAVAADVAMLMHRPISSVDQHTGVIYDLGKGWRLTGHVQDTGPVVVIDDTVMTGNSLKSVVDQIRDVYPTALLAALYVNPEADLKPDLWVRYLSWPHILEWNLFNSILTPSCAFDMDGVLCHDCPPESDDDGPRYGEFMQNVRPKFYVRRVALPLVVTARLSKYEAQTRSWLAHNGFRVDELVMGPWRTNLERSRADVAKFKSDMFKKFSSRGHVTKPPIFVESDPGQAERIALLSGGVVVCPTSERCY